jgi:Na+/H+ antiporter NhaD/arsenite permease-like protein
MLAASPGGPAPSWFSAAPFVLLLLAIAVLPLLRHTQHWWDDNRNKLIVSLVLSAATLAYYHLRGYGAHGAEAGLPTLLGVLRHALIVEFLPFIVVLFSLYVVAGGVLVRGDIRATPLNNTIILGAGSAIASFIGTTGAAMVLIRLLLRTNSERRRTVHTVVFFIFVVCNIGGTLLPIGDPPLLMGYFRGVPFLWTLRLWAEWALTVGILLAVYFVWDTWAYRHEAPRDIRRDIREIQPVQFAGWINVVWMIVVVAAVATLDPSRPFPGTNWTPPMYLREGVQLAAVGLSLWTTPGRVRRDNGFNYHAIAEVAALFIGIFVTMQTPIEILHAEAPKLAAAGFDRPWQFFWATGALSSFLDNAPTYVVFLEAANRLTHEPGPGIIRLLTGDYIREDLLVAVSLGAVFMGANTYIGNGPNFMVKAIAERSGVRMPSFFGYLAYSGAILVPLFVILTLLLF